MNSVIFDPEAQAEFLEAVIPTLNQSAIFVGSSSAPQCTNLVRFRRLNPCRLDFISDLELE